MLEGWIQIWFEIVGNTTCAELGRRDVGAYSISYLWRIIVEVINPVLINVESWSNVIVLSATVSAYAYHDPQGCQHW